MMQNMHSLHTQYQHASFIMKSVSIFYVLFQKNTDVLYLNWVFIVQQLVLKGVMYRLLRISNMD